MPHTLCTESDWNMFAQRLCGVFILWDTQSSASRGPEQALALSRRVGPHNLKRLLPTSAALHFSLVHTRKCYRFQISSVPPPEHLTVLRQPWDDTEQMPENKLSFSQMEALTPIPQNNSPAFWYYDTMILALLAALWSSFNKNCGRCSQSGCSLTCYSATFLQLFNKYSRHGQDNFFYPERGVSVSYNN